MLLLDLQLISRQLEQRRATPELISIGYMYTLYQNTSIDVQPKVMSCDKARNNSKIIPRIIS